ncbi:unnamed protein product [Rotaria magnacalcarata]|uniref:Uncharacterized protein n=2 Tax=Rotaria magnacalcarata TaxID=392030 RepID=A0A8S3GD25_9BILA|nr:unnamed protein product [Rotaria magnacalcarata]
MPSKRPIKAFYVPKKTITRDISQISSISPIPYRSHSLASSPALHFADINHSPNPMSYSPLGRRSQVSNFSQRENKSNSSIQESSTKHDTEVNKWKRYKRWLLIIGGILVAVCLIALIALLSVMISTTKKGNISQSSD